MDEQVGGGDALNEAKAEKKNIEVLIDGRVYTLAGSCPEEHLQRIGRYIDRKISEARSIKPITAYNFDLNTLFIIINLVDDLLDKTDKSVSLKNEMENLSVENKRIKSENENLKQKLTEARKLLDDEKKEFIRFKNEIEKREIKK